MANKPKKEKFFGFSFYALFHEIFTLSVAKFMQFFNAFPKSGFFGAYRAVENQQNVDFVLWWSVDKGFTRNVNKGGDCGW